MVGFRFPRRNFATECTCLHRKNELKQHLILQSLKQGYTDTQLENVVVSPSVRPVTCHPVPATQRQLTPNALSFIQVTDLIVQNEDMKSVI